MKTSIETLERLEAEIGRFELKDLLTTLSTQMHNITYDRENREEDGVREIVIAAPWIAFIATAISQRKGCGGLSENKGDIKRWAKKLDSVFNSLFDEKKTT